MNIYLYFILFIIIIICIVLQSSKINIEKFNNFEKRNIEMFVINLDRNSERYNQFIENYKRTMDKTLITRFSAVDGNALSYKELEEVVSPYILQGIKDIDATHQRTSNEQMTRGMVGCYLSHIRLYEQNVDKNNLVLVFEDDAKFDINLYDMITNFKEVPDDWDILLLGTVQIFNHSNYSESWKKVYEFWGTQGYLINNNGMKKMLQYYKPMQHQIDFRMGELAKNNLLNIYSYKDNLIYQCAKYSDVQMSVVKTP